MLTQQKVKRLLAMATVVVLGLSIGAGTASATDPEFAMSHSSGRVGFGPIVSEDDPCPSGFNNQSYEATITAGNNATETNGTSVDLDGHWTGGVYLNVPLGASQGTATVTARCYAQDETGITTTQEYAPQQFTVSGSAATIYLNRTTIGRGETFRAGSSVDCPWQSGGGDTFIDILDMNEFFVDRIYDEPEPNGDWSFVRDIPDAITPGAYQFVVTCYTEVAALRYAPAQVQIIEAAKIVSLGDSYSSGVGSESYYPNSGDCLRSPSAYPVYLADQRDLSPFAFPACSGARTADFYGHNPVNGGELPQRDWLTGSTEMVTATMGGNDAGFVNVMSTCAEYPNHPGWGCKNNSSLVSTLYERIGALAGTGSATGDDGREIRPLKQMYMDIAAEAPNAAIFVAGYPKLFGSSTQKYDATSAAPSGYSCSLAPTVSVDYDDAQWFGQVASDINTVIQNAVNAASIEGANIHFVPVTSTFAYQGLCDLASSWIHPIHLTVTWPPTPKPESLHPTPFGQIHGYGAAFVSVMNSVG